MTAETFKINPPEAPKLLADEFDTTLPAIGQPLIDGVSVEGSGRMAYINIHFSSGVSSTLTLTRTVGAVTVSELLNGGANIPADAMHVETVPVVGGELINLTYGATSDTYTCRIGAVVQNG